MTKKIAVGRQKEGHRLVNLPLVTEEDEQPWTAKEGGLQRPVCSSTEFKVADSQKVDRCNPRYVVTCGGGLDAGHAGGLAVMDS